MRFESFIRLEMDSGADETVQETKIFGASLFLHKQSAFKTDLLKIGIYRIRQPFWNQNTQNCFSVISWKLLVKCFGTWRLFAGSLDDVRTFSVHLEARLPFRSKHDNVVADNE
jgi:hypothetical protein